jgi:hypothetical protein
MQGGHGELCRGFIKGGAGGEGVVLGEIEVDDGEGTGVAALAPCPTATAEVYGVVGAGELVKDGRLRARFVIKDADTADD